MMLLILFTTVFISRFFIFSLLEMKFPAYKVKQREFILNDLLTMIIYTLVVFPISQIVSTYAPVSLPVNDLVRGLPVVIQLLLYLVVGDFFHYFLHRLLHTKLFWRVHIWHHSPNHMGYMAGFRASILDATIVNIAYLAAWPLLGVPGVAFQFFLLLFTIIKNDWMHLNVKIKSTFLDRLIVMPRYHHIHHSKDKDHYTKNLAPLFPVWDHLFGTYYDPDKAADLKFGAGEKRSIIRFFTGV